ncbi:unnamed protein product [Musa hybrid cultivar]
MYDADDIIDLCIFEGGSLLKDYSEVFVIGVSRLSTSRVVIIRDRSKSFVLGIHFPYYL